MYTIYFQEAKTVVLEDLAAHFKMKAQDTIDRVTQLLEQGLLSGVMDDRGKFIYISQVSINCYLLGKPKGLNYKYQITIYIMISGGA